MICPLSNTIQNVTDVSSKKYQQEKKSQNYTFWNVFFMNQWFGFKKISQSLGISYFKRRNILHIKCFEKHLTLSTWIITIPFNISQKKSVIEEAVSE